MSSEEAEFRGISEGITEVMWLRKLLNKLDIPQKKTCKLYCDNKSAISISRNLVQHDHTKHVEIDKQFITKKLEKQIISLLFKRSKDQLDNILIKVVTFEVFEQTLFKVGIDDPKT